MKKSLLSYTLVALLPVAAVAQDQISIASLNTESVLKADIENKTLTLQKDAATKTFPITKVEDKWQISAKDNEAFYNFLAIDSNDIQTTEKSKTAYLINLAVKHKKLLLEAGTPASPNEDKPQEDLISSNEIQSTKEDKNWLLPTFLGLGGLALGIGIGMSMRKKSPNSHADLSHTAAKFPLESGDQNLSLTEEIEILKEELYKARNENEKNRKQRNDFLDNQQKVFERINSKILEPLQQALNAGKKEDIVKYVFQAAIVLSSFTKDQLERKVNYDIHNLAVVFKNATSSTEFETIDKNTPVDRTPNNIKAVIAILEQMGVKGLDDYLLQGYFIKNLNA